MGGLDWQAEAGGWWGGKEGRAGGWGPRASAGGKLGLLPTSKPVPTCLTSTSPGLGRPHSSRPPHGARASLQDCLASTWQEEWLQTRASVTSNPKPDLGRVQTLVLAPKAAGRPAVPTPQPLQPMAQAIPALQEDLRSFTHSSTLQTVTVMLCGLGQVSCPLWPVTSAIWQEVPGPHNLSAKGLWEEWAGEGGQEAQGGGSRSPHSAANGSCNAGSSLVSPESSGIFLSPTHCRERLSSPSYSLPFLRAPDNPSPH